MIIIVKLPWDMSEQNQKIINAFYYNIKQSLMTARHGLLETLASKEYI